MFEIGKTYKTRGGWDALVIWKKTQGPIAYLNVIHKPNTEFESVVILHDEKGAVLETFSVNSPPFYDGHPADLIE